MSWISFKKILSLAWMILLFHGIVVASATDLVGRNGQFTVKESNGSEQTVDSKQLEMQKELMPSAPRAKIEDAGGESAPGEGDVGSKQAAKKAAPAAVKPSPPKPETPEEKATRAADVETLRAMRKQGGAYFYTEDNQPIPFDEIDRRIESGEVEGIKAVGLHLQEWKPETKKKAPASGDSDAGSGSSPATAATSAVSEAPAESKKKY